MREHFEIYKCDGSHLGTINACPVWPCSVYTALGWISRASGRFILNNRALTSSGYVLMGRRWSLRSREGLPFMVGCSDSCGQYSEPREKQLLVVVGCKYQAHNRRAIVQMGTYNYLYRVAYCHMFNLVPTLCQSITTTYCILFAKSACPVLDNGFVASAPNTHAATIQPLLRIFKSPLDRYSIITVYN